MIDHDQEVPRWSPERFQWLGIALVGVLAAWLGFWGFCEYFQIIKSPAGILDIIYCSLSLFMFQYSADLGAKPWQLEVARFLAPVVTSYTVVLTLLQMMGRNWKLRRLKGHVVVCGLGCKGVYLAKHHLRAGDRVVIIEADEDNDWIDVCRSLGAIVLNGSAADKDMLRQARVASASQLIALCENDTTNIQIATLASELARRERSSELTPLQCLVHIVNLKWCTSLRSLGVLDGAEARFASVSFNFFENSARSLLQEHPLDRERITHDDPRQVHLVIVDANDMAKALMIQTIRVAHFANHARPRITIIDEHAARHKNLFCAEFPFADQAADIEFRNGTAQDPAVRRDLVAWAGDCKRLMTVAVCIQEEMAAMETALTLPAELRQSGVSIFIRLAEESGIAGVLDHVQEKLGVRAFGSIHDGCSIHEDLDRQAKAMHEVYLAEAKRAGRTVGQDAAMRPWNELDAGFKDSNRQLADHIPIKLRAIGCVTVPAEDVPGVAILDFTAEEIEILSRMEHARWCAERFLAGWTLGPSDKPRQVSPYLVPYDQLDDKIKEYDRVAVRNIPRILWEHAGMGLKRL